MPGAGAARPRRCLVAGAGVLGVCLAARLAELLSGVAAAELTPYRPDRFTAGYPQPSGR